MDQHQEKLFQAVNHTDGENFSLAFSLAALVGWKNIHDVTKKQICKSGKMGKRYGRTTEDRY